MKRAVVALVVLISSLAVSPSAAFSQDWDRADLVALERWVSAAPDDALPRIATEKLDQAVMRADQSTIDREANSLALRLARMHLLGCSGSGEKAGWNIADSDKSVKLEPMLAQAVASGTLDTFFAMMRPTHPDYARLRAAYITQTDPEKRKTIALNMERWRWMPRSLGQEYVLVNAPMFEASLWRGGTRISTWKIIVGKTSTPTPVFDTSITGVILNPWWDVPASIVRESVGSLVRRNPSLARARGYVWSSGRIRQKPGPNNALGQMKLVMPNRFTVYMHDTPNKDLFNRETRAFSHGCIRTGDAIGYAATLLEGVRTREEVDAIVASGKTTTVDLARPVPVYITYLTAATDNTGELKFMPDLYRRDARMAAASKPGCGG